MTRRMHPSLFYLIGWNYNPVILLMVRKFSITTWDVRNLVNNWINYQTQLGSRILYINSSCSICICCLLPCEFPPSNRCTKLFSNSTTRYIGSLVLGTLKMNNTNSGRVDENNHNIALLVVSFSGSFDPFKEFHAKN